MDDPHLPPTPAPPWWWRLAWRMRGSEARLRRFKQGVTYKLRKKSCAATRALFAQECARLSHLIRQGLHPSASAVWDQAAAKKALRAELGWLSLDVIDNTWVEPEALAMVLAAGADPNYRESNNYWDTLLGRATRRGYVRFVPCLLEAGANPYLADSCHNTPWSHVLDNMYRWSSDPKTVAVWEKCLEALFAHGGLDTPPRGGPDRDKVAEPIWWQAAIHKDLPMLQRLHRGGADLHARTTRGENIFEALLEKPYSWIDPNKSEHILACAKWLCEEVEVSPAHINRAGNHALMAALNCQEFPLLRYLVERGTPVDPDMVLTMYNEPPTTITLSRLLVEKIAPTSPMAQWLLPQLPSDWWSRKDASGRSAQDDIKDAPSAHAWSPFIRAQEERQVLEDILAPDTCGASAPVPRRRL